MTRRVPDCGVTLIRQFESLHDGDKRTPNLLEPMADPVGIFTCGYGYALFENGKPVKDKARAYEIWRQKWPGGLTVSMAEQLLQTVSQEVCDRLLTLLPNVALNDNELGALVSLDYNIGIGNFATSTVRKRLIAGDRPGAADAFRMWDKSDGHVLAGLDRRREKERELFLTPINSDYRRLFPATSGAHP